MHILYGVVGEGMGHAMRSRVILEHLVAQGHHVEIMASGRAAQYLAARFEGVNEIHGLHIIYEENRMRLGRTVWSNVRTGASGIPRNIATYFKGFEGFRPDVVISDFESWTHLYGKRHDIPVLSIDNMQIINRCKIPKEIRRGYRTDFEIARAFVRAKLPGCAHYFITTFFRPKIRKKRTTLHPPILRPEILSAKPEKGDHLLVYQTAEGHEELAQTLAKTGLECRIYGMRRDIKEDMVEGKLRYRPFNETVFIDDLRTARGVISGGGFTLMGECVYLHKPVLSVPVGKQFEQVLNARYLEHEGYGVFATDLDDPAIVHGFLERLPDLQRALDGYAQDGNRDVLQALDDKLDQVAAGIL